MQNLLADFPLATVAFVAGIVVATVAYFNGDLNVFEYFAAIGFTGVGTGAIGKARADSGKGIRR